MHFSKKSLFIISTLFLWCCSNSTSESENMIPGDVAEINEDISADTNTTSSDSLLTDTIENTPITIEGMLLVAATGEAAVLGTNDKNALESETPQMKVVLDYDYWMERHETTCGEFIAIMKKFGPKESFANTYKCESDSLPIADVTYYDAVLFANAKSRSFAEEQSKDSTAQKTEIDTVYDYAQVTVDEEGHCTNLPGFIFHPERNGFRLPTEAEWVKAASLDWDAENSWNNDNSGFAAHEVCSKAKNDSSFCDLAGNLMEWVYDWLGKFKDTTVTNYVGAPDGGELGERIVKGGAFNTEASGFNTYSRGDVYTVTSSTRADYVGFRLAYGSITSPLWMDSDGKATGSIITALASSFDMYPYTKSYSMKLAFRNDVTGNLAFIDYTSGTLSVTEIPDTMSVYHPEISPDGERVAFSTIPEGISGKSTLYVRNLDGTGSGLVKLDVNSAAIPRWRILPDGDTVIVYVTDAGNNELDNEWESYSTWQVPFANGTFSTPRKIMDGSFHGGVSEDGTLAVTGARLLRARIADEGDNLDDGKDSLWYNGEQACNATMAQDGSKRTAFLDFGGKTGRAYVGKKYGTHQYLLVADSTGSLTQYAAAPAGYTFDHTEWAVGTANENLVAALTNANGAHKRITLINLAEGNTTDLAEGDELWHPSLWIKARKAVVKSSSSEVEETSSSSAEEDPASSETTDNDDSSSSSTETASSESSESNSSRSEDVLSSSEEEAFELDPDSAGMYYISGASDDAEKYRYKMQLLWQHKDSATMAFFGSSRIFHALDPLLINKPNIALNMANDHNTLIGSLFFFENYVLPHIKNLKFVVVGTDLDRLKYLDSFWESEAFTLPGYVYDRSHNYWQDSFPRTLLSLTDESPIKSKALKEKILSNLGYRAQNCHGWKESSPPIRGDSVWNKTEMEAFYTNLEILEKFAKLTENKGIFVIALEAPQNPAYKNTGSYGRYGLQRSSAINFLEQIQSISKKYPHFIFMNENNMGEHNYTSDMAYDDDHLGNLGAEQLTHRLDSLIQTLNIDFGD